MRLDAILDLFLGSPRRDRVDKFVAAAVLELRVGPSQVLQVVNVVGQPRYVGLHVGTGASAGLGCIGREDDGLFHANHRFGSDRGARLRGKFRAGRSKGGCRWLGSRRVRASSDAARRARPAPVPWAWAPCTVLFSTSAGIPSCSCRLVV